MNVITYPIKKLTTLGTHAVGTVMSGAKAGVGLVEHVARTVTGGAQDSPREEPPAPTASSAASSAPTTVADPPVKPAPAPRPKPRKAPAKTQGDAIPEVTGTTPEADTAEVHPLLADEHVVPEEEVVYSAGPDIEEPIEELISKTDDERL